jgi:hypothetical protein
VEDLADVADEPPPEDVLQAAGELAELAEAEEAEAEAEELPLLEPVAAEPIASGIERVEDRS